MNQQLVDPFIPAKQQPRRQPRQHTEKALPRPATPKLQKQGTTIDGFTPAYRPPAGPLHVQYRTKPEATAPAPDTVQAAQSMPNPIPPSQPPAARKPAQAKNNISTLWLMVSAAMVGLALFSVVAGQVALAIYAIMAVWRRWPSQHTFMLALVMFVAIIVASVLPPFRYIADNLAVYAFLLLCIGTISLAREVRQDRRQPSAR